MKITASYIIIGDEILSGRVADANLNFLAKELTQMGIILKEARVIADNEDEIIAAINDVKTKYDYVFTSGGVGPTHDDITTASIANALGKTLYLNEQAISLLEG
ncbi:MAG: competence/damage-inducible protein A, partial [Rickettsiales bacterium]|nr:competence/damage-inducible protein A [Rickettsiales bacterium]